MEETLVRISIWKTIYQGLSFYALAGLAAPPPLIIFMPLTKPLPTTYNPATKEFKTRAALLFKTFLNLLTASTPLRANPRTVTRL